MPGFSGPDYEARLREARLREAHLEARLLEGRLRAEGKWVLDWTMTTEQYEALAALGMGILNRRRSMSNDAFEWLTALGRIVLKLREFPSAMPDEEFERAVSELRSDSDRLQSLRELMAEHEVEPPAQQGTDE